MVRAFSRERPTRAALAKRLTESLLMYRSLQRIESKRIPSDEAMAFRPDAIPFLQ